jgi:hypothetical protein
VGLIVAPATGPVAARLCPMLLADDPDGQRTRSVGGVADYYERARPSRAAIRRLQLTLAHASGQRLQFV